MWGHSKDPWGKYRQKCFVVNHSKFFLDLYLKSNNNNNLEEMEKFLEKYNFPKLNQKEI